VVHSLDFYMEGSQPSAGLVLVPAGDARWQAGDLLGLAPSAYGRRGTIFRVTPSNGSSSVEYEFGLASKGAVPMGGLVRGRDGLFYGTANLGGPADHGTLFKVSPITGELTLLNAFIDVPGGTYPTGLMRATDGNFYGTTEWGGTSDCGTVYRLTPAGAYTVLHSFDCTDGYDPWAKLVEGYDGAL
jgi:uncharacterized repeat protein (TIGR03803 family)